VAGVSTNSTAGLSRAVLYRAGKLRDLTAGATQSSYVWSVNNANHAVGFMAAAPPTTQAMLWDGKTATVLPTLGGDSAQAFGINASGIIAGSSTAAPGGTYQACRWDAGVVSALSADPGVSSALDINAGGQIVGANAAGHAALWNNHKETDLGTLGGDISLARTINAAGLIAGHSTSTPGSHLGDPGTHAFLWNSGAMTDLGALPEADVSYAWDINSAGVVAGTSAGAAVIWRDGAITNLNDLIPAGSGWTLLGAYGINDAGQIAGIGQRDGKQRGFRLTPVAS
jgi:probable HAF family extracellular repeat protein